MWLNAAQACAPIIDPVLRDLGGVKIWDGGDGQIRTSITYNGPYSN